MPLTVLSIDWVLNRIWIEWNQLYANLVIVLLYGFINMAVTFSSGEPVYPPLSWDSVVSWIMGLAILPIAVGYFAGLYYLTKWKFRKLQMHD